MNNLIFDRVQADVNAALQEIQEIKRGKEPSQEFIDGLKGLYTYKDLNRVENAVKILGDMLASYGYFAPVITKTDWKNTDFFYENDLQRYIKNINTLRNGYYAYGTTPATPNTYNSYSRANDIEKILFDITNILKAMEDYFLISGTFSAGNNRTRQHLRSI